MPIFTNVIPIRLNLAESKGKQGPILCCVDHLNYLMNLKIFWLRETSGD